LLEISSFIIRVIEMRVTTVVMPMVRPKMRKRTLLFRLRRLLIEISLSLIYYASHPSNLPLGAAGKIIFSPFHRGG